MKSTLDHNIYEFHLNNGSIVVADVVDSSGDQYVVFDPLQIVTNGKQWLLQKYFQTSSDRWVVFHDSVITSMSRMDDGYVPNYINICNKLFGPVEEKLDHLQPEEGVEIH